MHANTPTPSEMLIPDLYLADQAALSETSVIECEIASRNSRKLRAKAKSNVFELGSPMRMVVVFSQVVILSQQLYIRGEVVKFC